MGEWVTENPKLSLQENSAVNAECVKILDKLKPSLEELGYCCSLAMSLQLHRL